MKFKASGVLLDIEGTTSSIRFVYDVMFPYVREHLSRFLVEHWRDDEVIEALKLLREELQLEDSGATTEGQLDPQLRPALEQGVLQLMDRDVKSTGLKKLQGMIWRSGFLMGQLIAHVYPDVPAALSRWQRSGIDIRIYSSGSVEAQQLFFGHTVAGNLLPHFSGHYDTTVGGKRDADSYAAIAAQFQIPAGDLVFVSDVVEELTAARAAGFQTALSVRPENPPQPKPERFFQLTTFDDLEIGKV